jgi:TolA-binding protein
MAGEAAGRLHRYPTSLAHFAEAAKSDSAALALEASWQRVAVMDSWYRTSQMSAKEKGSDSLAVRLVATCREHVARFPADPRGADITWRQAAVSYAHGWYADAADAFAQFPLRYPGDKRALDAARMCGDAHYRMEDFEAAGGAYEKALELSQAARDDTLSASLRKTIPLCHYKHAESIAHSDGAHGEEKAAPLFAGVARRFPEFEHRDVALYRAGLGFAEAERYPDAVGAWEALIAEHPRSEYVRDCVVQIAEAHVKTGDARRAAAAYERLSGLFPADPDAPAAMHRAVELLVSAKDRAGAEAMEDLLIARFPGDVEAVMEIRERRSEAELSDVMAGRRTLASILPTPAASKPAARAGGHSTNSSSNLAEYLALAEKHPTLASQTILARVDYLRAEETYPSYTATRLTQPLPAAIERKKAKLEEILAVYDRCIKRGVSEYARASAHRIGQALVEFGDALIESERPKDMGDADLAAYDEVLAEQSWQFYDRGIDVWSELVRQAGESTEDTGNWMERTRQALWPRLARRFLYQPEVEYPLVAAEPPATRRPE